MTLRRQQDRKEIIRVIQSAANEYKKYLVGRTFLYVFDNRYIEVLYKAANFKHLTGVESHLSAKDFYKNALRHRLQSTQIFFSSRHPYQLCKRKLQHLHEISHLAQCENFMLEEIITNTRSYRFGTTDLNFTLCMNKEQDSNGKEKGTCFIVESLRDEDCFSKSKMAYDVTHILSKKNDEKLYHVLHFQSHSAINVPSDLYAKLDEHLRDVLQ